MLWSKSSMQIEQIISFSESMLLYLAEAKIYKTNYMKWMRSNYLACICNVYIILTQICANSMQGLKGILDEGQQNEACKRIDFHGKIHYIYSESFAEDFRRWQQWFSQSQTISHKQYDHPEVKLKWFWKNVSFHCIFIYYVALKIYYPQETKDLLCHCIFSMIFAYTSKE